MAFIENFVQLLKLNEESVIKDFVSIDEALKIVNTEGVPLTVLNQGFRKLLSEKGTAYDQDFPYTTVKRPFTPLKVTRAVFLLNKGPVNSTFLIVETDSYSSNPEDKLHDPNIGDVLIWPLDKKNAQDNELSVTGAERHGYYTPQIILSRGVVGNETFDSGYAYSPAYSKYGNSETVYEGGRILEILKTWIGYKQEALNPTEE